MCLKGYSILKLVTDLIESNEDDGDALYQDQKVNYYLREKKYIKDHIIEITHAIILCYERRYGNLYSATSSAEVNINADEGDRILFDVCRVLNCNV